MSGVFVVHRSDIAIVSDRVAQVVEALGRTGHSVIGSDRRIGASSEVVRFALAIDAADSVILVDPSSWWAGCDDAVTDLLRARLELCAVNHVERLGVVVHAGHAASVPELDGLAEFELPRESAGLEAWLNRATTPWPEPRIEPPTPTLADRIDSAGRSMSGSTTSDPSDPAVVTRIPIRFVAALEPIWARLSRLPTTTRRALADGLTLVRSALGPLPNSVSTAALGLGVVALIERHASDWLRVVPGHLALAHPWIGEFLAAEIDLDSRDPHTDLLDAIDRLRADDALDPDALAYATAHESGHRQARRGLDANERRIGDVAWLSAAARDGTLEHQLELAVAMVRPEHLAIPRAMLAIAIQSGGYMRQQPELVGELFWRELVARGHSPLELDDWLAWTSRPAIRLRNSLVRRDHCERVLVGHTGELTGCGINHDATLAITVGSDRTLRVWDPSTGVELRALEFSGWGMTCGLTPDGRQAVIGCNTKLSVVDPQTLTVIASHDDHSSMITSVAISPDGGQVLSGDRSGRVVGWRPATDDRRQLVGDGSPIHVCAVASDGLVGASADNDERIRVWALDRGVETASLRKHEYSIGGLALTDDGSLLSSGIDSLRVWSIAEAEQQKSFDELAESSAGMVLVADQREVVIAESGKRLRRFTRATGSLLSSHYAHPSAIRAVAATPDGEWTITAGDDRVARVWRHQTTRELEIDRYILPVTSVIAGSDPKTAWIADSHRGTRLVALDDDRTLAKLPLSSTTNGLARHEDRLYCASGCGELRVFSTRTFEPVGLWKPNVDSLSCVAIDPHARMLACSHDGIVILYSLDGTERGRLSHGERVSRLEFDADGRLVSSGWDGRVCVWDLETKRALRTLIHEKDRIINSFVLDRPRSRIAIAGTSGSIRWIADADGERLGELAGHTAGVEELTIHAQRQVLASASADASVRLWSLIDGRELACYRAATPLAQLAFVGDRLVAGDQIGNNMILDIDWRTIPT